MAANPAPKPTGIAPDVLDAALAYAEAGAICPECSSRVPRR